jgi:hypothetical protein
VLPVSHRLELQQTPSTQCPEAQAESVSQSLPGVRFGMHSPSLQKYSSAQSVASEHSVLQAVPAELQA